VHNYQLSFYPCRGAHLPWLWPWLCPLILQVRVKHWCTFESHGDTSTAGSDKLNTLMEATSEHSLQRAPSRGEKRLWEQAGEYVPLKQMHPLLSDPHPQKILWNQRSTKIIYPVRNHFIKTFPKAKHLK
jgi:hypothetical protein